MFDAILQFTRTKINSLNDVFQTRSLVGVFRKDASLLQKYAEQLTNCCSRLLMAQVLIHVRTSQCRHQDASPQILVQPVLTTTFLRCTFIIFHVAIKQVFFARLGPSTPYILTRRVLGSTCKLQKTLMLRNYYARML